MFLLLFFLSAVTTVEVPRWLSDLIYIILINIGDLYRYLNDIYSKRDEDQAETYFNRAKDYYAQVCSIVCRDSFCLQNSWNWKLENKLVLFWFPQAFVLFPESGFAMNQIGNLSVKLNGGIDTTYYMLHRYVILIVSAKRSSGL